MLTSVSVSICHGGPCSIFRPEKFPVASCGDSAAFVALSSLHDRSPSRFGNKYRSLICLTIRHELHLREFLLRYLLLGFSHVSWSTTTKLVCSNSLSFSSLSLLFFIFLSFCASCLRIADVLLLLFASFLQVVAQTLIFVP